MYLVVRLGSGRLEACLAESGAPEISGAALAFRFQQEFLRRLEDKRNQ